MLKQILLIAMALVHCYIFSQVGIGTTNPHHSSVIEIQSTTQGILIPRLLTTERNAITNPAKSLLIFNTTNNRFEYNSGTSGTPIWSILNSDPLISTDSGNIIASGTDSGSYLSSTTYMGKFIITSTGIQTITGLPFEPTQIKFSAHANIETYNLDTDNGVGNNNGGFQNSFGSMQGYATNYGGTITQQVIYIGGSGNSINDISRYASSSRAIGIRYSNNNGNSLGLTAASVSNFNASGFTLNVSNHTDDIVVIFEAHR